MNLGQKSNIARCMELSDYLQQPNETNEAYRLRLYRNKDLYGLSNAEIGTLCNRAFGVDWDESAHRKKTANYIRGYDAAKQELFETTEQAQQILREIEDKTFKMKKEQVKVRDERVALNRQICELARHEATIDTFKKILEEHTPTSFDEPENTDQEEVCRKNNDLVVHLTDLHTDATFDNYFDSYNLDILKKRLGDYLKKIKKIQKLHKSENCYLLLGGDLISGLIHFELRVESKENVIQQVIDASGVIAAFTRKLSKFFKNVYVHSVFGNHGRVSPDKKLSLKNENFDCLIPFFMKSELKDIKKIHIVDNENEEKSMIRFNIRGFKIGAAHGDKDTPEKVVGNFAKMFREFPDIIYIGHYHSNGYITKDGVKVIMSGSLQGMDDYCVDHRIYGLPEQTVSVISDNGFECLYDITLK